MAPAGRPQALQGADARQAVLMGRRTAESLGRALPGRRNLGADAQRRAPFAGHGGRRHRSDDALAIGRECRRAVRDRRRRGLRAGAADAPPPAPDLGRYRRRGRRCVFPARSILAVAGGRRANACRAMRDTRSLSNSSTTSRRTLTLPRGGRSRAASAWPRSAWRRHVASRHLDECAVRRYPAAAR